MKLTFVFENGDGLENDVHMIHDESAVGADDEICTNDQVLRLQYGKDDGQPGQPTDTMIDSVQLESLNTAATGLLNTPDTRISLSYVLSSSSKESPLTCSNTTDTDIQTPDARSQSSRCIDTSTSSVPPLTHREALLMQYFIRIISPWALSQPEHCHDDILIVTMVCLRLYELFNQQPLSALHLDGLASLLGAIPDFLQSGELAEASAWLALRHDLFMAMVTKRAPRITLNDYDHSSVFQKRPTPGAAAYAIILIWAKILRHLYSTKPDGSSTTWLALENALKDWYDEKRIEPLFQQDANVDPHQPFPIISMNSAPHVIAVQYYHTCQVYLNLHKPLNSQEVALAAVDNNRSQAAISAMCAILGIALSNTWVEDAVFPGLHILITCGHHLTDSLQREHAVRFLNNICTKFGYRTDKTASALQHQWAERDASKG
ncbi:hypothetical protein KCU68_g4779, partial [Aureobasidium melanogenum]